jgi:hypothetical protein
VLIAYQPARWNSQNCSGGPIAISYAGSPFRFLGILFKPKVQSLPRAEVARSSQNFPSLNRRLAIVQATAYDVNGLYGVHGMTFPLSISSFYFFIADSRGVMLLRPLPVRCGGSTRLHPITNELRPEGFTISATSLALQGASWFLGVSEWVFGALLLLGFWNKKLGILGALGLCVTFVMTITIMPFMPGAWNAGAGGFPAMQGNEAFLMKDVVLFAVSFYLLKQDLERVGRATNAAKPSAN